ncbi:hypothetical protein RN001_009890 [Aquatica leii]|uniref:Peptidase C45 hydrolase domain-containing protein n=1 Tax=Aquatica leii TaxID=1421715 RepID=A0AAN7PU76_9COLE|nr:hypothetical protein RN001_009890 [Aquatica leii]
MPAIGSIGRRHSIPIIYTRGTHYEVGFDVGRTFASLIQEFIENCSTLNEELLPAYNTIKGRQTYEDTLLSLKTNFPQYIRELEGTADGSKVPFYKLFLLHLDRIITVSAGIKVNCQPVGCSTICVNQPGYEILGHTEDAITENLNHFYFVSAHITSEKPEGKWKVVEERFTSLCYPGHLPGYTMSYNHHGLVFSINTLSALNVFGAKTPRHFLTRALLSAENYSHALQILEDVGCGAGDGCSINLTFLNEEKQRTFYNIEMAPSGTDKKSLLNVLPASLGENLMHTNKYMRVSIPEEESCMLDSSVARMIALQGYSEATNKCNVIELLSNENNKEYPVFVSTNDFVSTIAVGVFDCTEKTWSIYADNPKKTKPLVVLPLVLKNKETNSVCH